MDKLSSLLLLAAAHEDMGIYPACTVHNGIKTERTAWQDGWNAATMSLTAKWVNLNRWFKQLPEPQQSILVLLLEHNVAMLSLDDEDADGPTVLVSMNDTFGMACADSEDVPLADLGLVDALWKQFQWDGVVGYAAAKRGKDPLPKLCTERFEQARQQAKAHFQGATDAPAPA